MIEDSPGICSHKYDARPAILISQNLGFTTICEDGFTHGYARESITCLFTPGSMPLHPRLHMFQLLVECTANQALSTSTK